MKTLHLYLLRQVLATLLMTVAVFAFVLIIGNVLREITALLVNRQATLGLVARALGLLLPFVMVYALPMGMLTATLLVFGRFSADQELTAVRSGGVSLVALVMPVLLLSVVLSAFSGWLILDVTPRCRVAYKAIFRTLAADGAAGLIEPNQFIRDFPGFVIYVGNVDSNRLENVLVYEMATNAPPSNTANVTNGVPLGPLEGRSNPSVPLRVERILSAVEATVRLDPASQQFTLHLPEAEVWQVQAATVDPLQLSDLEVPLAQRFRWTNTARLNIQDMTFGQLMTEYYELRRQGVEAFPVSVVMHQKVAFSFAAISFTLVGIPLGVRAHRRETSAGIAIALVLVMIYYSFILFGQVWMTQPRKHPDLLMWAPNFLFQAVGAWLLWRANRRG